MMSAEDVFRTALMELVHSIAQDHTNDIDIMSITNENTYIPINNTLLYEYWNRLKIKYSEEIRLCVNILFLDMQEDNEENIIMKWNIMRENLLCPRKDENSISVVVIYDKEQSNSIQIDCYQAILLVVTAYLCLHAKSGSFHCRVDAD